LIGDKNLTCKPAIKKKDSNEGEKANYYFEKFMVSLLPLSL
jgi:hypothetical protein